MLTWPLHWELECLSAKCDMWQVGRTFNFNSKYEKCESLPLNMTNKYYWIVCLLRYCLLCNVYFRVWSKGLMVKLAEEFWTKNFGLFDLSANLSLSHFGISKPADLSSWDHSPIKHWGVNIIFGNKIFKSITLDLPLQLNV